mmetsp:Transcript_4801/g.13839  ORF Transcript_4801/g.13839 Transcript_4801/m.13839 type:complete len:817 (+) Transcript_4801:227-2677(+)
MLRSKHDKPRRSGAVSVSFADALPEVIPIPRVPRHEKAQFFYTKSELAVFRKEENQRHEKKMMKQIRGMVRERLQPKIQLAKENGATPEELDAMVPTHPQELFKVLEQLTKEEKDNPGGATALSMPSAQSKFASMDSDSDEDDDSDDNDNNDNNSDDIKAGHTVAAANATTQTQARPATQQTEEDDFELRLSRWKKDIAVVTNKPSASTLPTAEAVAASITAAPKKGDDDSSDDSSSSGSSNSSSSHSTTTIEHSDDDSSDSTSSASNGDREKSPTTTTSIESMGESMVSMISFEQNKGYPGLDDIGREQLQHKFATKYVASDDDISVPSVASDDKHEDDDDNEQKAKVKKNTKQQQQQQRKQSSPKSSHKSATASKSADVPAKMTPISPKKNALKKPDITQQPASKGPSRQRKMETKATDASEEYHDWSSGDDDSSSDDNESTRQQQKTETSVEDWSDEDKDVVTAAGNISSSPTPKFAPPPPPPPPPPTRRTINSATSPTAPSAANSPGMAKNKIKRVTARQPRASSPIPKSSNSKSKTSERPAASKQPDEDKTEPDTTALALEDQQDDNQGNGASAGGRVRPAASSRALARQKIRHKSAPVNRDALPVKTIDKIKKSSGHEARRSKSSATTSTVPTLSPGSLARRKIRRRPSSIVPNEESVHDPDNEEQSNDMASMVPLSPEVLLNKKDMNGKKVVVVRSGAGQAPAVKKDSDWSKITPQKPADALPTKPQLPINQSKLAHKISESAPAKSSSMPAPRSKAASTAHSTRRSVGPGVKSQKEQHRRKNYDVGGDWGNPLTLGASNSKSKSRQKN